MTVRFTVRSINGFRVITKINVGKRGVEKLKFFKMCDRFVLILSFFYVISEWSKLDLKISKLTAL